MDCSLAIGLGYRKNGWIWLASRDRNIVFLLILKSVFRPELSGYSLVDLGKVFLGILMSLILFMNSSGSSGIIQLHTASIPCIDHV